MPKLIPVLLEESPDPGTAPVQVQHKEWCLVWYSKQWHAGYFVKCRDKFWNFYCMYGQPWQYDKPGYNSSRWPDTIWIIEEE